MCPVCGCIEDENRPNQETFECIECGYKNNADFNAANNIRNRVCVTVLRNTLLKQLDNGALNIIKKEIPNAFNDGYGIEVCSMPLVLTIK